MNHIKILSDLDKSFYELTKLREEVKERPQPDEVLGFEFRKGQRVKDKVTGKGGEIIHATRTRIPA